MDRPAELMESKGGWLSLIRGTKKHGRPKAAVLVVQSYPFRDSRTKLYVCFECLPSTTLIGLRWLLGSELLLSQLLELKLQLANLLLLLANDSLIFSFGVAAAVIAFHWQAW